LLLLEVVEGVCKIRTRHANLKYRELNVTSLEVEKVWRSYDSVNGVAHHYLYPNSDSGIESQ